MGDLLAMIDWEELASRVETIARMTDTDASDVIESLIGVAWDEEDAGTLKRILGKK